MVRCLWKFGSNRSRKRNAHSSSTHSIRFHRHFARLDASKRIRFGLRSIIIYCSKHKRKHSMENIKSNYYKILIRNIILRVTNCSDSSCFDKAFDRLSVISSFLSIIKSKSIEFTGDNFSFLLGYLSTRL